MNETIVQALILILKSLIAGIDGPVSYKEIKDTIEELEAMFL